MRKLLLVLCGLASSALAGPVYDPFKADQFQTAQLGDSVPADPAARRIWARNLAFDATIYGTAAVLEYRQLFAQAIDAADPSYVGFNRFAHGRTLAGPDYKPFKTPNADTLYSNAYLDLRNGPVLFEVPDTAGRYYTANFLDIHGNATNISARTHGTTGGRYLIATTDWRGTVPAGATLFRVSTPIMWILLRVLVDSPTDIAKANALQDRFRLTPMASSQPPTTWPDGRDESSIGFFHVLDFILRTCGHPANEDTLVHRWQAIGLDGANPFDEVAADAEVRAGIEQGYAEAQTVIAGSMAQNGRRNGGWTEPVDIGRYGSNYLYRAAINTLGTGANVVDENHPFTSFHDATGEALDGSKGQYELRLAPPPPARFFWSVTVYDRTTRALFANPLRKYVIGDRTPGLRRGKDGSVTIRFQTGPVAGRNRANWLPVPAGPFYVVIRAQGPEQQVRDGQWKPPAIQRLKAQAAVPDALFAGDTHDVVRLATRAYVWGMPLVEAAQIRMRFTSPADGGAAPGSLNRFKHRRKLAGPEMRAGVGPNNDTIYSLAWVDLADGPLVMTAPDFGNRYYTFSINFADSAAEQSLGQRTHGGQLPPLFLHGPGWRGSVPKGMVDVPSPTRYANIAGRILVRGPDEYAEVNALQDKLALYRWSDWKAGRRVPAPSPAQTTADDAPAASSEAIVFFQRLGAMLRDWHPSRADTTLLKTFPAIGLTQNDGFHPERLSPDQRAALEAGYRAGKALVAAHSLNLGVQSNGWTTNYRGPRFGNDWLLRAAVAKDQIFVAIPEEAIYPVGRVDSENRPLDGRCRYRIRFAADKLPPVDGFWSITAYGDDGFMIPNPVNRYSVGDRSPDLRRGRDGTVSILLSRTNPADPSTNWLPVGEGRFYLMMRLYRPRAAVLSRTWQPPAIERDGNCA